MQSGIARRRARFQRYSHASIVDSRIALNDFGFQTKIISALAFFKRKRDGKIERLADPRGALRPTDRQSQ
ncbi:MAG: hypothetical protein EOP80_01660 [Variovorax sp.]|nr:MAG: hypothetical protein EOP80_01660 [Variovorax sp.]